MKICISSVFRGEIRGTPAATVWQTRVSSVDDNTAKNQARGQLNKWATRDRVYRLTATSLILWKVSLTQGRWNYVSSWGGGQREMSSHLVEYNFL